MKDYPFLCIIVISGDYMEHREYKRIIRNSDIAILFIHGIVGTPNHFNEFISLVPEFISVYNMLLDGHGKGVKDFSKASMKKWESQVTSVVEELSLTHKEIYIVAHSMGTLLAMEQAIKNKKISKLFLVAVPLSLALKPKMPINSLKVYFDKIRLDDYEALAAKKCYGIGKDRNPFRYIGWIPRFLELFKKISQTRKIITLIDTECSVYQSGNDEMVSKRSIRYLENNPYISVKILKSSGHYYYDKKDWDFLLSEFEKTVTMNT